MSSNSTNKPKSFLGSLRSLFSHKTLTRLFSFICPQQTIVINNITVDSNISKEEIERMTAKLLRDLDRAIGRGAGI